MRNINFNFWLLNCLLEIASVVVIGQTVTVSITQVGNDVVFRQEGSLDYFPRHYGDGDEYMLTTAMCRVDNTLVGNSLEVSLGQPNYIGLEIAEELSNVYEGTCNICFSAFCVVETSIYNVSFACLSDNNSSAAIIDLPEDTGGMQTIGFTSDRIYVASDYTLGTPMSGNFTVAGTTLDQLVLVEGKSCFIEYNHTYNDGYGAGRQRIEFVVEEIETSEPTTAAPSTAAPTKSPTAVPITTPTNSPTIATTTTMNPTMSPTTAPTKSPTAAGNTPSGGTFTVSIAQVGNDVVIRQQGSLNFLPSSSILGEQSFGIGLLGDPGKYIILDTGVHTQYYMENNTPVSYACLSSGMTADSISFPSDTDGVQSIGFYDSAIYLDSNYTLGATMSGSFTIPGTTLADMSLVDGETCSVEYTMNGEVQRLEFVVGQASTTTMKPTTSSPTTAAPNNNAASTTKSPTAAPITTTTNSPTTMSPTTIAPRRERLRNRIENIPIIGPALLRLLDLLNIFN